MTDAIEDMTLISKLLNSVVNQEIKFFKNRGVESSRGNLIGWIKTLLKKTINSTNSKSRSHFDSNAFVFKEF